MIGLGLCRGLLGAMIDFGLAHQVARIRERRDPTAEVEPGIPADMIGMKVRAHHDVDVVRRASGRRQSGDVAGAAALVPIRPGRPLLVLADAGIDEDGLAAEADQMALNGEQDRAVRPIDMRAGQRSWQ